MLSRRRWFHDSRPANGSRVLPPSLKFRTFSRKQQPKDTGSLFTALFQTPLPSPNSRIRETGWTARFKPAEGVVWREVPPPKTFEAGLNQRSVVIEFDSVEKAIT